MVEREREYDKERVRERLPPNPSLHLHVHAVTCFDLAVSDWVPNFFVECFFAANRGPI